MKILVIGQHFYPENFKINAIVASLVEAGHEICVLTGYPNYPQGEFYRGYSPDLPYEKEYCGAKIERVKIYPRKKGKWNLTKNYLSFWINADKWVKKNAKGYDVTYCCQTSPIFMSLPCITAKKKFGIPTVINVQDMWPECFACVMGINFPTIIKPLEWISNRVYKNADMLLCSSKSFIDILLHRGVRKERLAFWPQYSPEISLNNDARCPEEYVTKYRFVFAGNVGEMQGLDVILDAGKTLKDRTDIGFYIIGDGSDKARLTDRVKNEAIGNVFFLDMKPENDIPNYLRNATASILVMKDNILSDITIPAKLQTYMACGSPIISTIRGEAGDIVREAKCGLITSANDGEALSSTVEEFLLLNNDEIETFKSNSIAYTKMKFDKRILIDELEKQLKDKINAGIIR